MQASDLCSLAKTIERWFSRSQRPLPWRSTYDPYAVWISEVMLQQTRMEVVLPYHARFLARFPTLASLAAAREEEVLAQWSGLGYYRRAKMLHEGARLIQERFGGRLPADPVALRSIPGIGRYTSGAIASIAFELPEPIVDGNVARILARLFGIDEMTGSAALMTRAWQAAESLVASCRRPRAFNQGLMELGALICRPRNPACGQCPLRKHCHAFRTDSTQSLPRPRDKQQTRALEVPLYVIRDPAGRILMRRERGRLMQSIYHLPHGATTLLPAAAVKPKVGKQLGSFRHTITNRRIAFHVYRAELHGVRDGESDYEWIAPAQLNDIPHPSYVAKALRLLQQTSDEQNPGAL